MPTTAHRNSAGRSLFRLYRRHVGYSSFLYFLTTIATAPVYANGEVSELITHTENATTDTVLVDGDTYQWGQDENLLLDGFLIGNKEYRPGLKANSVSVQRRDIAGVATGELCSLFSEQLERNGTELKADFPSLEEHAGICDMPAMLMGTVINQGTLDTFTNTGPNPTNIERIDYLFDGGIVAPADSKDLPFAGHLIGEKHGNNRVQMAAILDMDGFGNPSKYGSLIGVGTVDSCTAAEICYGKTSFLHDYGFFKSHSLDPLGKLQAVGTSSEPVAFAFLSMETLEIPAGGIYYGISVFPHDVKADEQDLLDTSTFPNDTEEPQVSFFDSADIYGGSAFLYTIPTTNVSGQVFCQADEDGTAPKSGVPISLYQDTVADGVLDVTSDELISELPGTTDEGRYSFLALENGSYFVVVSDRVDDDAARVTVVINSSPVVDADIVLNEACGIVGLGPKAFPDTETMASDSVSIAVLKNDENADGLEDASDLVVIEVSESDTAEIQILDDLRTVLYTPTREFSRTATLDIPAIETFEYIITDDSGLTSKTTVTITIIPPGDPVCETVPLPQECLFVETEVDGVGRIPPLVCFLLLTFVVIRRNTLFVNSMGEQS